MKHGLLKRVLSLALCLLMVMTMLPFTVGAANFSDAQLAKVKISGSLVLSPKIEEYINSKIYYYLKYEERVVNNLNNGDNVIFFFDGCSSNLSPNSKYSDYKSYHITAYCAVIKLVNGEPKIVYENNNTSTIPDNPRKPSLNGGTAVPTVVDGIYNIYLKNHPKGNSSYAAINLGSFDSGNVIRLTSNSSKLDASAGINIHARSKYTPTNGVNSNSKSSTGCFNVGLCDDNYVEYNNFIKVTTGVTNAYNNKHSGLNGRGKDIGIAIVDRYNFKEQIKVIYGGDNNRSANDVVNAITEYTNNINSSKKYKAALEELNSQLISASNSKISVKDVPVPVVKIYESPYEFFSGSISATSGVAYAAIFVKNSNGETVAWNYRSLKSKGNPKAISASEAFNSLVDFSKLAVGKYKLKLLVTCKFNSGLGFLEDLLSVFDNFLTVYEGEFTVSTQITPKTYSLRASNGIKTDRYGNTYRTFNSNLEEENNDNSFSSYDYYNGVSTYPIGKYKVKVNTYLNVREKPSANSRYITRYSNGTVVNVTATDGNWGYTDKGWICLDYTTFVAYQNTTYNANVNYGTGNYVVTTSAGLNCRKGAGTSYNVIKALPHGTQFSVTQTDGAWGYSPEHGGWLCLQYASYVSALTPSLPVPALPNLSTTTSSEIGVGEVISFKWDAVDTAELYNVKLIDANTNKEVQSTTVTGTNASFKTPYEGKFNVSVSASNSQHDGPTATLYGFTAKAPSTVTFKDWDGKVISTQEVAYGKDATAPTAPSRVGHTFTKWDGSYTQVRENQVVTATYTKNKYKVTFCDYDGTVLSTQDVYYGDAATAPKYTAPTGYSFVKWDTKFDNITKATTVKAVISWTSLYPLEISTSSAVQRNNKSYIVTSIVNNSPNAVNNARIIAVLKTKENKLLATVQSENISLAKGEVKNLTLTASYEGMATKAEIFVVKADNENIPLAKQLTKDVDQGTAWSSWSTSKPPADALQTQSRTEYRYRDKQFTTSTSSTLNGWTLRTDITNPSVSYGSWSGWSAWQDSSVSSSDIREVKTQQVDNYNSPITETRYTYKTVYNYYRYASVNADTGGSGSYAQSSSYPYYRTYKLDSKLTEYDNNYSKTRYHYWYNSSNWVGVYACDPLTTQEVSGSYQETVGYNKKTQYSYRTRSKTTTYYFWKWGDWSSWSTTAVSGTNNRAVETRTTYRYLANATNNIETTAGNFVERNGTVDKSYANRQALLFVMDKNGTTQFVGQTVVGADGSYAFKFKTKDEPTVTSGDYKVMLSIEGTTAAFELESIKAPVPEYKVKFVDYNGTVISEQTIKQGEDATIPAPLSREGYRFIGWDKSYTNIQGNVTINAQYEIKSFDVVFVDEINDTSVVERYNYGDTLVVPEVTLNDAYNFLGWDAVIDGNTKVTENMVVTAKFEKKMLTVDFLDFDGSLLESQTVEYGEPAIIPELENRDNYVFISWNIPGDTTYVTESMTIEPYYEYTETVATPTANIETGTYSGVQTVTLSCETEGAQIYYTTDGSDPLEEIATYTRARSVQLNGTFYTGPFELDSTSQLLFTAVKDGMNASDYDYKTLAINTADTENKQYTVTIHYGIYDAENTILVNDGELVVLDEELENYGYTLEGIYTDAEYKNAWNLETDTVKGETDLYLKWSKNNYTVTFKDMNDNVIDTQTVAFGDDAVAPVWNEVDGYIFTGWDTDYTNVIEDITVTATYVSVDNVTSVEFVKETLAIVEGQSETIKATVKLGTDCENDALIWQSSDEDVVIVDDNGKITAVAVGTATIFAISEDSGMSAQCEVTVDYKDPCAALGHKHEGRVTAPSCTEKGYTTYTCSVCGDTYTANEKASLGHNMSEVVPILAPSCENAGHNIIKCSRCEYSEVQQIEATGHSDNDNNNICDNCGKELSASSKCSCNCHKTGFMSFIWKILRFFYKLFGMNKVCGCGVAHY